MEFQKIIINRVDAQEKRPALTSEHLFADVVFLNKTQHCLQPMLYRLNDDKLNSVENLASGSEIMPVELDSETFILMGEVQSVDKKKKQIHLDNQNTVSYQYLIVVSSVNDDFSTGMISDEQFAGGLHMLIDALKMRDQILLSLPTIETSKTKQKHEAKISSDNSLEEVVRTHINQPEKKMFSLTMVNADKKLYEVQL